MAEPSEVLTGYVARMRELEREFIQTSGLSDRGFYRILYSHIHRFPLMVLGQNPGGVPGSEGLLCASDSYFENYEHDYVRFRRERRYRLAQPVWGLLCAALGTHDTKVIRQVPASNVVFRRSQNSGALKLSDAIQAAGVLSKLVEAIDPNVVLLISGAAYETFLKLHCIGSQTDVCSDPIKTPNGASKCVLYTHCSAYVRWTRHRVRLICTGHPSKYSSRLEWPLVTARVRQELCSMGMDNAISLALKDIPNLPDHV